MQHSERIKYDLEELRELKGMRIIKVREEYPYFRLHIDLDTTPEDISALLDSMPIEFEFKFFDFFYPQISDPGAYITVQKSVGGWLYHRANHGWSPDWQSIKKEDLIDYVFRNRGYDEKDCWICRRSKAAVLGARPYN